MGHGIAFACIINESPRGGMLVVVAAQRCLFSSHRASSNISTILSQQPPDSPLAISAFSWSRLDADRVSVINSGSSTALVSWRGPLQLSKMASEIG